MIKQSLKSFININPGCIVEMIGDSSEKSKIKIDKITTITDSLTARGDLSFMARYVELINIYPLL